jgi:hypothetical protein
MDELVPCQLHTELHACMHGERSAIPYRPDVPVDMGINARTLDLKRSHAANNPLFDALRAGCLCRVYICSGSSVSLFCLVGNDCKSRLPRSIDTRERSHTDQQQCYAAYMSRIALYCALLFRHTSSRFDTEREKLCISAQTP